MWLSSRLVCYLLFASVMGVEAIAQNFYGGLSGEVQDANGARLPGASLLLHSLASSAEREAQTDTQGEFRVEGLRPDSYDVTVTAPGFAKAQFVVTVLVGSLRPIVVHLLPETALYEVKVRGQASSVATQPIDTLSAVHLTAVTSQDLENLPLAARSFANIAYLAPGTEPVEPSDPTKARITAVSTGGSSGLNNELSVDGADNSDDYIGGFLQNFSPDGIQEFAIRTAQEDADTGGTTAGSVVITTKRGTNSWHGETAIYDREAALNARFPIENPTPNPKQPFSRQNYIGTLGAPIQKNKSWFFVSFEHVHENASVVYSPASTVQFDALSTLASEGLIPGVSDIAVPASVPIHFRDYLGSLRLDWAQSAKSSWFLRGSVDNYTTNNDLVEQATLPSVGLLTHNNYLNLVISNQYLFGPKWLASFVFGAGGLHLTQTRNSNLGFALAFPFSSTSLTVSGFETFGDNQFATPITFFPSERNQEKYQLRYDVSHVLSRHTFKFGINLIHEPVLGGAFPSNTETLYQFPQNPTDYLTNPAQFTLDFLAGASTSNLGGGFSQNVQRLAVYGQDSWRLTERLTLNYGLRYGATFGLVSGTGRSQLQNPAYITLQALQISLLSGAPHDDRKQFGPRIGVAFSLDRSQTTMLRGGFGIFLNDLAQTGWSTALQAVNMPPGPCLDPLQNPAGPENAGCVPGGADGGVGNAIAPGYKTPYAIHTTAGIQHSFGADWLLSADYTHEQGNHAYRAYSYTGGANLFTPLLTVNDPNQAVVVPNMNLFRSDNRSSYNALMVHLQGNVSRRLNLVANYTFSKAQTWGCVLGELFDYVNGVCNPLDPFGPGDYGPSGEDVRHRAVVAGTALLKGGVEVSTLTQAESARPFTITTVDNSGRIAINDVLTSLDQFRGTPYIQSDVRVSRPVHWGDRWTVTPFVELFNIFNRNNPGANYVTNIATLPVPSTDAAAGNVTQICADASCTTTESITSAGQLRVPGGALGDFFGPGTTVGIPFAAQLGVRITF